MVVNWWITWNLSLFCHCCSTTFIHTGHTTRIAQVDCHAKVPDVVDDDDIDSYECEREKQFKFSTFNEIRQLIHIFRFIPFQSCLHLRPFNSLPPTKHPLHSSAWLNTNYPPYRLRATISIHCFDIIVCVWRLTVNCFECSKWNERESFATCSLHYSRHTWHVCKCTMTMTTKLDTVNGIDIRQNAEQNK